MRGQQCVDFANSRSENPRPSYSRAMSGDQLYYYVRDRGSSYAHHWDYARSRSDHALCGQPYGGPVWEGEARPKSVCRACQALLAPHEASWWRTKAEALLAETVSFEAQVDELRERVAELEELVARQRVHLRQLNTKVQSQPPGRGDGHVTSSGSLKRPKSKRRRQARSGGTGAPDNSREAITRRLQNQSGPLAAAEIPTSWRRPPGRSVRVVSGGLPGLGKRR